ncbi:MAG TPA: carbohydrate porin [Gammaproteobacteria bacterium]|nr:carbohydrate porin [Gammaproteobacteria bacterium]
MSLSTLRGSLGLALVFAAAFYNAPAYSAPGHIDFGIMVAQDYFRDVAGGAERGGGAPGILHLTAEVDSNSDIFHLDVLGTFGSSISDNAGDLQTLSNFEAYNTARLFEAWYQRDFAGSGFSLRLGMQDYNVLFDVLDPAQLFINSSFGIEPTISQVPVSIFPETTLGAVARWRSRDGYVLAGVYDGTPGLPGHPAGTHVHFNSGDGLFSTLEAGIAKTNEYKLAAGYWYDTASVDYPIGHHRTRNHGWYTIGSMGFSGKNDAPAVHVFMQLGGAPSDRNPFARYIGAGITLNGFVAGRPDDTLGLAVARAGMSRSFRNATHAATTAETAFELTYQTHLTDRLYLQPDVQYIISPGGVSDVDDALVVGLRISYSLYR